MKNLFLDAYEAHADAIYRHCFFRVYSRTRAEELVQETFMRAWKYLQDGKVIDNIRAFLYRVAGNLIIDESRKKKESSLDALMESEEMPFEPSNNDHRDIAHKAIFREVLDKLRKIPENDRELVTLRFVDDLDPKEIGEITGMSANNVSVRIHRALESLKIKIQ